MNIGTFELEVVRDLINEARRLRTELEASQARENVLREALMHCSTDEGPEQAWVNAAREALALPADDTALRQAIKVAKEEMRERCADIARLEQSCASECGNRDAEDAARRIADDILALEVE